MPPIPVVNIASPEFKANPFPFYARLRSEAPVHHTLLPDKQSAWLITRYDDALAVLKDDRFGKDRLRAKTSEQIKRQPWIPNMFKPLTRNMLDLSRRRLGTGNRADGVVVFERPPYKQSNEQLFLQMAESGAADRPALAPIGFGVSSNRQEEDHGRTETRN